MKPVIPTGGFDPRISEDSDLRPKSSDRGIAVLYVARGGRGGLASTKTFIRAYSQFLPGCQHRLYLLAKNWRSRTERRALGALADAAGAAVRDLPDDGFDWGAYFRALDLVDEAWLCLLNSYSRPLASAWLQRLGAAAACPGVGMAGASGSWESFHGAPGTLESPIRRLKRRLAKILDARRLAAFDPFPNPHLRTTGLVIAKSLFADFAGRRPIPRNKHDAHCLESGRVGLSAFVRNEGLELVVVGADGQVYRVEQWPLSRTFRAGRQENLLIADNRTTQFATAQPRQKRRLASLAWGSRQT